jgi:hypothetical protein
MTMPGPLTVQARNVNDAYKIAHMAVQQYREGGAPYRFQVNNTHRNMSELGSCLQATYPVTTIYGRPTECVLVHPTRNANPFFHLLEALWMLNGDNDVTLPAYMVQRMAEYSDNGTTFYGAYGFRWRQQFDIDQVRVAINTLRTSPSSRRVVIGMWDPYADLIAPPDAKDLPCNLMVKLEVEPTFQSVNATVYNRSNDVIWGCYGANAVQFSVLLQFVAGALGKEVGWLCQFSANWHVYANTMSLFGTLNDHTQPYSNLARPPILPLPLFHGMQAGAEDRWLLELQAFIKFVRDYHATPMTLGQEPTQLAIMFMEAGQVPFLKRVAAPMADALLGIKQYQRSRHPGYLQNAHHTMERALYDLPHNDWLTAGMQWIQRFAASRNLSLTSVLPHV